MWASTGANVYKIHKKERSSLSAVRRCYDTRLRGHCLCSAVKVLIVLAASVRRNWCRRFLVRLAQSACIIKQDLPTTYRNDPCRLIFVRWRTYPHPSLLVHLLCSTH